MKWAQDLNAPRLFWLRGSAGTGKTTVSQAFQKQLLAEELSAVSYFCKQRREMEYSQANKIIPAIATALAKNIPTFNAVSKDELDRGIWHSIERQFYQLIVVPFESIPHHISVGLSTTVVIVDSLDECEYHGIEQLLLAFYTSYAQYKLPLKFFVTGRSNSALQYFFSGEDNILRYRSFSFLTDEQDIDQHIRHYIASTLQASKAKQLSTRELELFVAQSKG